MINHIRMLKSTRHTETKREERGERTILEQTTLNTEEIELELFVDGELTPTSVEKTVQ